MIRIYLLILILASFLHSDVFHNENVASEVRNIALLRAAYHSSSIDVHKTGHLTTNGLISTLKPNNTISVSSQWLDQPRTHSVRTLLNRNRNQTFICIHPQTWVDVTVPSSAKPASSYTIRPGTYASSRNPKSWTLLGSNDNRTWAILSDVANFMFEENVTEASHFQIDQEIRFATYRLNITKNNGNTEGMYGGMLELAEFDLLDADGKSILHRPASNRAKVRDKYWEARTTNNEWVVIDFGALSSLSTVVISWGLDSIGHEYDILVSNGSTSELQNGKAAFASVYEERSGGSKGTVHTIKLKDGIFCRLMKLLVRGAVAKPLSSPLDAPSRFSAIRVAQIEVIGSNDLVVKPSPRPPFDEKRMRQDLSGGSWKVKRASEVEGKGSELSLGKEFDEDIIEREQSGGTAGRNTEQAKEEADKADRMEDGWVIATVPGTVLVSYLNVGAIPDPNFGDQQLQISDWFFTTDFWYCSGFDVSEKMRGKRCWLNFDGINWKADIWVNGVLLSKRIEGAFIRGKYDITNLIKYKPEKAAENGADGLSGSSSNASQKELNHIAVFIHRCNNPGEVDTKTESYAGHNGGVLGKDNPTIHASVGWDWVMTVRGRNTGIYNDVYLTFTGDVVVRDPWVETHVRSVGNSKQAQLTFRCEVMNAVGGEEGDRSKSEQNDVSVSKQMQPAESKKVEVRATLEGTDVEFVQTLELSAQETKTVEINATLDNPKLWWPNRYGEQHLYKCHVEAKEIVDTITEEAAKGKMMLNEQSSSNSTNDGDKLTKLLSDFYSFDVGVRDLYFPKNGILTVIINGKPIFCSGGNWGMDESMMRCRTAEDYEIRVRLHKEAHFTMIRNWVGMTGDEEFYSACDRNGILVFDDFWLANPWDGPEPDDPEMFMRNARDKVRWARKHPSLCVYCGRNEGSPPASLYQPLKQATTELDGSRLFVGSSTGMTEGVALTGNGPYSVQGPAYYYRSNSKTFHTEMGMPNVPSARSIREMLPAHRLWPRGELWGLHDFALGSAQNGRRFLSEATLFGNDRVFNKEAASEAACAGSSSTNSNDSNTSSLICSASFAANPFEEFVWRSQFVNYENHKAMFEGSTLRESRGLLMWMSQSCWPSMVWQTYDFFFDTNAGYFGCKKGNQPFSVVYNIDSKNISVVNNAWKRWENVKIEVWVHDLHGKKLNSFEGEMTMSENTMVSPPPFAFSAPQEGIFFVSTRASQVKGEEVEVISDNFYWDKVGGSRSFMDFSGLKNATIAAGISGVEETPAPSLLSFWSATPSSLPDSASQSSIRRFSVTLINTSPDPALLVHLQLYRVPSSSSSSSSTSVPLTSRVLPVYFSDNWFGLMPQTSKTVSVEFDSKWLHRDSFVVVVDGYNVSPIVLETKEN
ncbi:putative Exo-beta-D-glucosaminidase precursor [Monocercomonoides exilis]|uniref:putative Exo-beta-D-glucosaminidase precursor n=1 Tax=Monocercomonoides exilis TaxID=2049356 RepID=UPI00355A303C|nr:putative Exo-beta-D-glucosaminidase precursor [Monocercomonoides exilis]